ncbi:MAG: hypothetical protein ACTSR8_17735 [Promethearchaeota archaeon]
MINYNFKLNWLKILNFNSNVEIWNESEEFDEKVRIPLTPIHLNASLLYYYFELLYPRFINDQQNIVDIIISDDKQNLNALYLYETKKAGIHESFRKLSNKTIIYQEKDLENIDEFFNKLQMIILEQENIQISTIRIFKQEAIELINTQCIDIEKISMTEFFQRITTFLTLLFEKELFYVYPTPNIFIFFKDAIKLLDQIKFRQLFEFLREILPDFDNSFVVHSDNNDLILKIKYSENKEISLNIYTLKELNIQPIQHDITEIITQVKSKLNADIVYYLQLEHIITLLSDLFDLKIPFIKENLLLFVQKALYAYRSYERMWFMHPRPKVYNQGLRLIARLFGINLNMKKLSHWAIPEIFMNSFISYFGLNSQILVILTDSEKMPNLKPKKDDYLKKAFRNAVLLSFENSSLVGITSIKKDVIIDDESFNNLKNIREIASKKYGYISSVLNIDKILLRKAIKNFVFKLTRFNPAEKYLALRAFKKDYYFNMYPELPPFKLIKEKGVISLFKAFLPILIDKHEF